MTQVMRERVTSLVEDHDGTIVPTPVIDPFEYRGSPAITMRYGSPAVHRYDEKSCPDFTLSARRIVTPSETMYVGRVETTSNIVRAFLFHTNGTGLCSESDLDAAITAFVLDLVEQTNTDDLKWYVRPRTRTLQEALAEYPYDFDAATEPRSITLTAPVTGAEFIRPSNLCVSDLRFVSLCRAVNEGDVFLETDASPEDVAEDIWFERAEAGVGADITLEVQERDDGGTQFIATDITGTDTP